MSKEKAALTSRAGTMVTSFLIQVAPASMEQTQRSEEQGVVEATSDP